MFYEVKLVTRKNNVYKNKTFQVSNSESHVIWRNSTLYSTLWLKNSELPSEDTKRD